MVDSWEIRTFAPGMLKCGHENMTPKEYIKNLRDVQRTLDSAKEDLDRAIDRMQRSIETGDEKPGRYSRLIALAGREYVLLAGDRIYELVMSDIDF